MRPAQGPILLVLTMVASYGGTPAAGHLSALRHPRMPWLPPAPGICRSTPLLPPPCFLGLIAGQSKTGVSKPRPSRPPGPLPNLARRPCRKIEGSEQVADLDTLESWETSLHEQPPFPPKYTAHCSIRTIRTGKRKKGGCGSSVRSQT